METEKKTALVISGGGCKGAFAVGIIRYLYRTHRESGWFSIVGGTSTGALIAPLAALLAAPAPMAGDALENLVELYSNVHTSDILKKKRFFTLLLRPDSLFRNNPLRGLLSLHFRMEWFEWLQKPESPDCYVVYTDFRNGKKVYASPRDPGMTRKRFIQCMLASASVPVVMEGTRIDGHVCYDGGIRDLLPFGRSINLGAETIVPIYLDPEELSESGGAFSRLDKVLLRTLSIMVDETGLNDYEMASLINMGIRLKREILDEFDGDSGCVERLRGIFSKELYFNLIGPGKRLVNIIEGLRPDKVLTDDSLTFKPSEMRKWIKQGENKAAEIIAESPFQSK